MISLPVGRRSDRVRYLLPNVEARSTKVCNEAEKSRYC